MRGNRISYLVDLSNGIKWEFICYKNDGIIYRIMKQDQWSEYNLIVKNCRESFSVVALPDESICLLYQDFKGNIFMKSFRGNSWYKYHLIKTEVDNEIYTDLKAVVLNGQICLFISILDKTLGTKKLFYQLFDSTYNQSFSQVIDDLEFNYLEPIRLFKVEEKESIYIMYQKGTENIYLGYKILHPKVNSCSDFNLIDTSVVPFIDYSLQVEKDILRAVYIKGMEGNNFVEYVQGYPNNYTYNSLSEDINIKNCSICSIKNHIYCTWIKDSTIYSSFSVDEGQSFSNPPYSEEINSSSIMKYIYVSNEDKVFNLVKIDEFYGGGNLTVYYPFIVNLFLFSKSKNNYLTNYFTYYMGSMLNNLQFNDEKIKKHGELNKCINEKENLINSKDQEIQELSDSISEKKDVIRTREEEIEQLKISINNYEELIKRGLEEAEKQKELIKNKDILISGTEQDIEELNNCIKEKEYLINSKDQEIRELSDSIIEKTDFIRTRQEEIEQLKVSINNYEQLIKDGIEEAEQLKELIRNKDILISGTEQDIEELNNCIKEKEYLINSKDSEIQELSDSIIEKKDAIRTREEEIEQLKVSINNYEELIKHGFEEAEQLKESIKNKDTLISRMEQDIEQLNKTIKNIEVFICNKKEEVEESNKCIKEKEDLINSKDVEIQGLSDSICEKTEVIRTREEEIKQLASSNKVKEAIIATRDQEINNLNIYIKNIETSASTYENKYKAILNDYVKFQESKGLLYKSIKELQETVCEKDNQIKDLEKQKSDLERDLYCLKQRVEEDLKTIFNKENEIINLSNIIKKLSGEPNNVNTDIS